MTTSHCSEDECTRPVHSKGLCQPCYRRRQRRDRGSTGRPGPKPYVIGEHCNKDHLLTEDNVYMERSRVRCRTCESERKGRTGPSQPRQILKVGEPCGNGHLLTEVNTYTSPKGKLVCKQCRIKSSRKHQGSSIASDAPVSTWNKDKTHCPRKHEYNDANTWVDKKNHRHCIPCRMVNFRFREYGITEVILARMLKEQSNACAICHEEFQSSREINVDHDHRTGKLRSLLCANCNRSLGGFKDSILILQSAVTYLERHNAEQQRDRHASKSSNEHA